MKKLTSHLRPHVVLYVHTCLALCYYVYVENIGFVYPAMSMVVIGPSLLYYDKAGGVCCMMFIDSYDDVEQVMGSKYLNTVQD